MGPTLLSQSFERTKEPEFAKLSKLIYRVNIILIKVPADFFAENDRLILIFICKCK